MDRRRFLQVAGVGVLAAGAGELLNACSSPSSSLPPVPTPSATLPSFKPVGFEVGGAGFAIGDGFENSSVEKIGADLDIAKLAGADTVRFDANAWTVSTSTQGLNNVKNAAVEAARRGLQSIVTIGYAPPSNRLAECSQDPNCPPLSIAEMADFAHSVVAMLVDETVMFEYINERNLSSDPNPVRYAQEFNQVWERIFAANKNAQLSISGLGPAENSGSTLSPGTFLDIALPGIKHVSSVGDHATCNPDEPGDTDAWSGFEQLTGPSQLPAMLSVADALKRHHMSGIPVNISEMAVSTFGKGPKETVVDPQILAAWGADITRHQGFSNGYATQAFQARVIREAMNWDYTKFDLNVQKVLMYTLFDSASMQYPYTGRTVPKADPPLPNPLNYQGAYTYERRRKLIISSGSFERSVGSFMSLASQRARQFAGRS